MHVGLPRFVRVWVKPCRDRLRTRSAWTRKDKVARTVKDKVCMDRVCKDKVQQGQGLGQGQHGQGLQVEGGGASFQVSAMVSKV